MTLRAKIARSALLVLVSAATISTGGPPSDRILFDNTSVRVGGHPQASVTADFDGDGIPDVAVANYDGLEVVILRGAGDMTFEIASRYGLGYGTSAIAAGDLNGDGKTDLLVPNFGQDRIDVLLGNGGGTFASPVGYPAGDGPLSSSATAPVGSRRGRGSLSAATPPSRSWRASTRIRERTSWWSTIAWTSTASRTARSPSIRAAATGRLEARW